MLHEFLTTNRSDLITRCRQKAALRFESSEVSAAIDHGVPLFLQQLVDTLRIEQMALTRDAGGPAPESSASVIGRGAAMHGAELLRLGFAVDQVVHEYGDVCQSVMDLATEEKIPISNPEFRTLNRCLDDAIADAVSSFGRERQTVICEQAENLHLQLNNFTAEYLGLIDVAAQALAAIKTGKVGLTGATGALLDHTLTELRLLGQRSLPEIHLTSATATLSSR